MCNYSAMAWLHYCNMAEWANSWPKENIYCEAGMGWPEETGHYVPPPAVEWRPYLIQIMTLRDWNGAAIQCPERHRCLGTKGQIITDVTRRHCLLKAAQVFTAACACLRNCLSWIKASLSHTIAPVSEISILLMCVFTSKINKVWPLSNLLIRREKRSVDPLGCVNSLDEVSVCKRRCLQLHRSRLKMSQESIWENDSHFKHGIKITNGRSGNDHAMDTRVVSVFPAASPPRHLIVSDTH